MKKVFYILFFLQSSMAFGQEEINAAVNYLNYDPFYESNELESDPVLPALSFPEKVGFELFNQSPDKEQSNNYLSIFPVANVLGSYLSDSLSTTSFNGGLGFGIAGQFLKKFYVRLILTGNYFYHQGSPQDISGIYQTDFFSFKNNTQIFGLQPQLRLSYSPYSFFNIQAGIDEAFIGQGKRSMLLGDYGSPYPFVQLRTKIWKINVLNLYQFFKETESTLIIPKYASTHFFNYNITKRLQVGVFESVIFAPKDTLLNRGYEVEYLNPFLFYRPTEYSLGSQDRLLMGLNMSYEFDKVMIYGQLAIDDFVLHELLKRTRWWANKYSGQIGIKGKQEFKNGTRLRWLAELNVARPFTYSHAAINTVYGNQGRPLAHPLGGNFVEIFTEASLHFNSGLTLKGQLFFVQQGGFDGDDLVSYGNDIYQPYNHHPYEYGYRIGGNGKVNRLHFSLEGNYLLSEKINIELFVRPGIELTNYENKFLVLGGIRTNLWNERAFSF